jgi:predicted transcriptional regulator
LVQRVSQGRVTPLVAQILDRHALSAEEIAELKELVAEAERKAARQAKGKERRP